MIGSALMEKEGEAGMTIEEWAKDFKSYVNELDIPRDDYKGIMEFIDDAIALLKEQRTIVRCKDCKHRPKEPNFETYESGFDLEFPEGSKCPCRCDGDEWYSWYPDDEWFCAKGERKDIRVN